MKKLILSLIVLVILCAAALSTALADLGYDTSVRINGTVLNIIGNPISGATVTVTYPNPATNPTACVVVGPPQGSMIATTNANGYYILPLMEVLHAGWCFVDIHLTANGYFPIDAQLIIDPNPDNLPTWNITRNFIDVNTTLRVEVRDNNNTYLNLGTALAGGLTANVVNGIAYLPVATVPVDISFRDNSGIWNNYTHPGITWNMNQQHTEMFTVRKHANLSTNVAINVNQTSLGATFIVTATINNLDALTANASNVNATIAFSGNCASTATVTKQIGIINGGSSAQTSWTVTAGTTNGTCTVTVTPSGKDIDMNTLAYATSGTAVIYLMTPAQLNITSMVTNLTHKEFCNRGQTYTLNVTARNIGEAAAINVSINLASSIGSGINTPNPVLLGTILSGASATGTFTVTCANIIGTDVITANANGIEINTGAPISAIRSINVNIQTQAGGDDGELELGGNVIINPALIGRNMQAAVTAIVTNDGQTTANAVSLTRTIHQTDCAGTDVTAQFIITATSPATANIAGGNSQTYTFNVSTTTAVSGIYAVCITAVGTDENDGTPVNSDLGSATFELDADGPYWSAETVSPVSGTEYNPAQTYKFSINWTDIHGVDTVIFEFNGVQYPVTQTGDLYTAVIGTLAANSYTYRWTANDTLRNVNSTGNLSYVVALKSSTCSLTFDKDSPQPYGTNITASCGCTNLEATAHLYRNGANADSENNVVVMLTGGIHNYVCNVSATPNYNAASAIGVFNITKINPISPMKLHLSINGLEANFSGVYPITVTALGWKDIIDGDLYIYLDNVLVAGPSSTPTNTQAPMAAGVHTYRLVFNNSPSYEDAEISRNASILDLTITSPAGGSIMGPSAFILANTSVPATCQFNGTYHSTSSMSTADSTHFSALINIGASGPVTYYVTCTSNGNTLTKTVSWTVDAIAPAVTVYEPSGPLYTGNVTLIFSPDENSSCEYREDTNATFVSVGNVTAGTNITRAITYTTSGNKTITVQCTDAAGNVGTASKTFQIDMSPPSIVLIGPPNNSAFYAGMLVLFNITDSNGVTGAWYSYNGGPNCTVFCWLNVIGSTYYTTNDFGNGDGEYNVTVWAVDTLGNLGSQNYRFIAHSIPPVVQIILPNETWYGGQKRYVPISVFANDTVGMNIVAYNIDDVFGNTWASEILTGIGNDTFNGTFNSSTVTDGDYSMFGYAVDMAGNIGYSQTVGFKIDNTGPVIAITQPSEEQIIAVGSEFMFSAAITDVGVGVSENATCTITREGMDPVIVPYVNSTNSTANTTGRCAGTLSYPAGTLLGTKEIRVSVSDKLGNVGTSAVRTINLIFIPASSPGGSSVTNNTNRTNETTAGPQLAGINMTISPVSVSMLNNETFSFTVTFENIGQEAIGGILTYTYDLPITDYSSAPQAITLQPGQTGTTTLQISPKSLDTGTYVIKIIGGNTRVSDTQEIMFTITNATRLIGTEPVTEPGTAAPSGGITGFFVNIGKFAWSNLLWILIAIAIAIGLFLIRGRIGPLAAAFKRKKSPPVEPQQQTEQENVY